jgi:hypothetical protein
MQRPDKPAVGVEYNSRTQKLEIIYAGTDVVSEQEI